MLQLTFTSRILSGNLRDRSFKETYWALRRTSSQIIKLLEIENHPFAKVAAKDMARFILGVKPLSGEVQKRAEAAVDWILRAQKASGNGGVSLGYFPCDEAGGWFPPYPETTGYIITSLLRYAHRYQQPTVRERALQMAAWEAEVQMPSGAVQGGPYCEPARQRPCAFNTGMVLDGWCSAYQATKDPVFFEAGRRAAGYLIGDMTDAGYFRTNGDFVTAGLIKTYNCLCAWSMYRFGELANDKQCQAHAVRAVEAAIRQQRANGWFTNNCLTRPEAPLLHTIAYTIQGILEVGILARREDFVQAAQAAVEPLLTKMTPDGGLPGRFHSDWAPASFSACLTGSAQLAVICYSLYEHTGSDYYRMSADRLLNFLKPLQLLDSSCADINGALPGSFPIFGEYMTAGYPNWATKYLLDALMFQDKLNSF